MEAGDLQDGFQLGEWLVEPRAGRLSGPTGPVSLSPPQMRILLCLAEHRGETVDRRTLRAAAWPEQPSSDEMLREAIVALRHVLGETPQKPRYIVTVAHQGFALIAHLEPSATPIASADRTARADSAARIRRRSLAARLQDLVGELRRRDVFKVTGAYLVAMWIVLQVAEVTFQPLRLPSWWMTALTILAIIGLPIVVVLAWSYEITPGGVVLDTGGRLEAAPVVPRARRAIAPVVVAGVAAMACVTGYAWWRSIQSAPADDADARSESGAPSIAVLPFVDMSPAGGNAYLGDGLSEELSTRLAQVPGLRVAARTSAFEFRGQGIDVRRIGEALGVRHVLEGSVRRDGQSVRVTVQLVDAKSGYHVWADSFDRGWRDVLALQDDIASSVTEALKVVLSPGGVAAPTQHRVNLDPAAIDAYLAGLALLRQPGDLSRLQQAEKYFADVLAVAPTFAGAHAGLCQVRARRYASTRDPADLAAAERPCRDALERDASLLDTRKALAGLYLSGGEFARAGDAYRGLLQQSPQDADAYIGLGKALEGEGRDADAEANFRRAVAVEPEFWAGHEALGVYLFQHGRVADALAAFRKVTELVPSSASAWSNLGGTLQMAGDFRGAVDAYRRSLQLEPSKSAYSNLATAQYSLGQFDEAARLYERALALGEHDQIIWGNLGDALWQIAGRRADAVARYRRAIELAEPELTGSPGDATLRAQVGYYYGRVGDTGRSVRYLEQAVAEGGDRLYVQYYRAVAAADRGDRETALQAVAALVRLGYPPTQLRNAPEFSSLLRDPAYLKAINASR